MHQGATHRRRTHGHARRAGRIEVAIAPALLATEAARGNAHHGADDDEAQADAEAAAAGARPRTSPAGRAASTHSSATAGLPASASTTQSDRTTTITAIITATAATDRSAAASPTAAPGGEAHRERRAQCRCAAASRQRAACGWSEPLHGARRRGAPPRGLPRAPRPCSRVEAPPQRRIKPRESKPLERRGWWPRRACCPLRQRGAVLRPRAPTAIGGARRVGS